jgi:hypothetical protein
MLEESKEEETKEESKEKESKEESKEKDEGNEESTVLLVIFYFKNYIYILLIYLYFK